MNIYIKNEEIATKNIVPEKRVYGERLFEEDGEEYRIWNPFRSKLAAALLNGLENLDIAEDWKILYLGASTGTTVSHISDIAKNGLIYAVEFSPVSMRKLVRLCESRPNIAPILTDATKPKKYMGLVEKLDFIYCDVAQPNQTNAFIDNINLFLKENGLAMIMIKSRSIDVNKKPQKIFKEEEKRLKEKGFSVMEKIKLEPYEKDHICFLVKQNF